MVSSSLSSLVSNIICGDKIHGNNLILCHGIKVNLESINNFPENSEICLKMV